VAREFPAATVEFIRRHIRSVEQLEILLLLFAHPERTWTAEAVFAEVRSNLDSVARRMDEMSAEGLLEADASAAVRTYRYHPATAELAKGVEDLSTLYRERRVTVIEHIFAEPPSPIQGFADSFRIRKDETNG
jgi:hypothetical protein